MRDGPAGFPRKDFAEPIGLYYAGGSVDSIRTRPVDTKGNRPFTTRRDYTMKFTLGNLLAAACAFGLLTGGTLQAQNKKVPARLTIEDEAGLFSDSTKKKAKETIANVAGDRERDVHIQTFKSLSDEEKKDLAAATDDAEKKKFWDNWSRRKATGEKGIVVLALRSPGHVQILVSSGYEAEGFTPDIHNKIRDQLLAGLRDASKKGNDTDQEVARDATLLEVTKYIASNLPTVSKKKDSPVNEHNRGSNPGNANAPAHAGGGIMSWLCIGLAVVAGIWMISALFRALTGGNRGMGGGTGGGGMGGGGMGGGGGGGGGFMSGMLGGLFGAVAGNYLYNNMFGGGHESSAYGGDSSNAGGGYDTSGSNDADFTGGSSTGGDYDTGGGGGGGGGGYDAGGSDFGGGGSDFGGGGGDAGGGGDF